jgi:hypothetical protein
LGTTSKIFSSSLLFPFLFGIWVILELEAYITIEKYNSWMLDKNKNKEVVGIST